MKFAKIVSILVVLVAMFTVPASAQFGTIQLGPLLGGCAYAPTFGIDSLNGVLYLCPPGNNTWRSAGYLIGANQNVTATAIADGAFNVLTGGGIKIPASTASLAGKRVRISYAGIYTTAAASLLNVEISFCTVSGCATGTVVSPAGCVVTSTNQANVLANGQFSGSCDLTVATAGASGTLMAKSTAAFNLGATTAAALSQFADTATAVSAAVSLTVDEFVHPQFKFTTLNAGNAATLQSLTVELLN